MDWRAQLRAEAARLGRPFHDHPLGVGIDFQDGCDAFWVLPGELTSTIPLPPGISPDPHALLAAYHDIDALRAKAIHVLRHYLAGKNVRVDRRHSGQWPVERDGGASTSISVGAYLTTIARDTRDVHAVVRACFQHSWLGKPPSPKRIDRYLDTPGPPAGERPLSKESDRPASPPGASPIRVALRWMGLCTILEHPEHLTSPDAIQAALTPAGRIGQALLHLADRLPTTDASVDLTKPGTLHLRFDDDLGGFDIDTRDRSLVRRIASDGPAAAGDHLADEFLALNAARAQTLRAIRQAAAARGWRQERHYKGFLHAQRVIHLGAVYRDVTFYPDQPLTDALRHSSPETAIRALFSAHPDFADACVAALRHPLPDDRITLPDANLRPRDIPPAPPLRTLDPSVLAELDEFADAAIADYWTGNRTIWDYRNRDIYDPPTDTWATPADWVRVAERYLDAEWPHPMAAVILLDAHDPRGDALARRYLAVAQQHDVGDTDVELVWRYRHAFPDTAREWFLPQANDDVPYARERAKLGDPVAFRRTTADATDPLSDPDALGRLSPDRLDQLHRDLLTWARTDHRWSPPRDEGLRTALRMGWRDVADAFPSNPYLLPGLLTHARRERQFDEPGLLLAKDFLLLWSRLAPGPFLARLIATAVGADLVAQAEVASRRSAAGKPDVQRNLDLASTVYRSWWADLRPALAITWKRCRPTLTA